MVPPIQIAPEAITARFLRYVAIDTQSDPQAAAYPSTPKQLHLSHLLIEELLRLGIPQVQIDTHGYVTAHIPPRNAHHLAPCIGFIAHVDTSPDAPGANVNPRIERAYRGGTIQLNSKPDISLSPKQFPELNQYLGQDIIVTDGTTLLGADDKAGIAAIMEAIAYLYAHPDLPHPPIAIAFTLDEEIGRGVEFFDIQAFPAQFAYTIDGGAIGELEYENFNAASATITLHGQAMHPGYAMGRMRNALQMAHELHAALPDHERPENTDGRNGFFHLTRLEGYVGEAVMEYIIRDFETEGIQRRKARLIRIAEQLKKQYGEQSVHLQIRDQYRNMRKAIDPHMHLVETARRAMHDSGITPIEIPIRGGTDGANLSWRGLPCPNLFAGGHNFHSTYEYLPIPSMAKAAEVIVRIALSYAQHPYPCAHTAQTIS